MSDRDPPKPPGRPGRHRDPGFASFRPPLRADDPRGAEDVDDEATWDAGGSPYHFNRENTAEVSFFEDHERTTSVDWNNASVPQPSYDDDAFALNVRPRGAAPVGDPTATDAGTGGPDSGFRLEPRARGPVDDRRRSARRDVIGPPVPRERSPDGVRPIPPLRRVGANPEVSGSYRPPMQRPVPLTPVPPSRTASLVGVLGPLAIAGVALLGFAALVLSRFLPSGGDSEIAAPMLPVVGGAAPKREPDPPFDLLPPQPYRADLIDPAIDPGELPARSKEARAAENVALAAALWDRSVRLDARPSRFYENARLLADVGEVDAAFYWLVRATREQGVPAAWLVEDRAFRRLWVDPRWDPFIRWVIATTRFFSTRGSPMQHIALPSPLEAALATHAARTGADEPRRKRDPQLPVLLWLDDVAGSGASVPLWGEALATQHAVVVIGLGGPERIGPNGGMWSGDPSRDKAYLDAALAALPGVKADPSRIYLAGVGQGAQYAVELMLRDPKFAKAAMVLSPTDQWKGPRDPAAEGAPHPGQHVVVTAGAHDPAVHTLARQDRGRLMRSGIPTEMVLDPEPWPDGVPSDLPERLSQWIGNALGPGAAELAAAVDPNDTPIGETPPAPPAAAPPPTPTP